MRLHKNLVVAVVETLDLIFNKKIYADKAVERILKSNKKWGARDRGFIAETTYEIVRWKRLYAAINDSKTPYAEKDFYQMVGSWTILKGGELPNWPEFKNISATRIKDRAKDLSKIRKYRESVPDWLDSLGEKALGEKKWSAEISALNKQASVVLRANTLKVSPEDLIERLSDEGIETRLHDGLANGILLQKRTNVFTSDAFKAGLFEVQDASSQEVAPFVEARPGIVVIDACAGAGGKSLHLAAIMQNKGQIIALDIYQQKLLELKRRARRNGVHNIETRLINSSKTIKKLTGRADRVLIDAPCSGLGVLKRNPDAKWKLSPEFIENLRKTQQEILQRYSQMVKPGGKLIYATCSILPSENAEQISTFCSSKAGQDFTLEEEKHIWPSESGYDGFYMARLQKSN